MKNQKHKLWKHRIHRGGGYFEEEKSQVEESNKSIFEEVRFLFGDISYLLFWGKKLIIETKSICHSLSYNHQLFQLNKVIML